MRKRGKASGFRFVPFSRKQRQVLGWWTTDKECNGIIADGAVRSGKTAAMSLGFVLWAMTRFSGQSFAICGKTLGAVERNILVGLRQMLYGKGLSLGEHRSEHYITISRGRRSNRFYYFGAKDEAAQDLIQGMTLAGVLFDEVALMPESFISQATARCSVDGSRWWFNCNPAGPYHWFKRDWIDRAEQKGLVYVHFTMEDNPSLTESIRKRYADMYSGVFYRRYVLGEWCAAEGLVYPMFERDCHVTEDSPPYDRCFLACDYGTHNPFALGLVSVRHTEKGLCYRLEREFYHDGRKAGQLTDSQYADRLTEFAGGEGAYVVVDPSASSFIAELRRRGYEVRKASNDVHEGIRCVAAALTEGRLTVSPTCTSTIREFSCYSWDVRAAEHGEDRPVKQNDHAMDMLRYALYSDRRMDSRKERYSGRGIRG